MADVRNLVGCWIDERVEGDSGVVTSSYEAFGDFIEWLKGREGYEIVERHQWGSAMGQRGFDQEKDGDEWIIRGIKLKED